MKGRPALTLQMPWRSRLKPGRNRLGRPGPFLIALFALFLEPGGTGLNRPFLIALPALFGLYSIGENLVFTKDFSIIVFFNFDFLNLILDFKILIFRCTEELKFNNIHTEKQFHLYFCRHCKFLAIINSFKNMANINTHLNKIAIV